MRLTTKYLESENYFADEISEDATEEEQNKYWYYIIAKLGQLEDIEEKHSVDLITIFKALENGCWIRKGNFGTCNLDGRPVFIPKHSLHLNLYEYYTERENSYSDETKCQEALCLYNMFFEDVDNIARVQDYGKTWVLTKEELV